MKMKAIKLNGNEMEQVSGGNFFADLEDVLRIIFAEPANPAQPENPAAPKPVDVLAGEYPMLVNKEHPVPETFVPQDLVMPDVKRVSDAVLLRRDAASGLEGLFTAAKDEKALSSFWP